MAKKKNHKSNCGKHAVSLESNEKAPGMNLPVREDLRGDRIWTKTYGKQIWSPKDTSAHSYAV